MLNIELFIEDIREQMQSAEAEQLEATFSSVDEFLRTTRFTGGAGRLELTQCFAVFIIGINVRNKLLRVSKNNVPHIESLARNFGEIMLDIAKAALAMDQGGIDDIYSILYKIQIQLRSKEIRNKNGRFKNSLYGTGTYVYSNRKLPEIIGVLGSKSSFRSYIEAPDYKQYEAYIVSFFRIFESNDLARIGEVLQLLLAIRGREPESVKEAVSAYDASIDLTNRYFSARMFFKRVDEFKQRFISKINVRIDKKLRNFHDISISEKSVILQQLADLQKLERFLPEGENLGFIPRQLKKVKETEVDPAETVLSQALAVLREEKAGLYRLHWERYAAFLKKHSGNESILTDYFYLSILPGLRRQEALDLLDRQKKVCIKLSFKPDYSAALVHCEEVLLGILEEVKNAFSDSA